MKPDKFDIKIQEAAAQNYPAYDEQAWNAMEKLLDEEMPQEKKDKRRILWLFLLLFIVAGGAFLMIWPWRNTGKTLVSEKRNSANSIKNTPDSILFNQNKSTTKNANGNVIPMQDIKKPGLRLTLPPKNIVNTFSVKQITDKIISNGDETGSRLNDASGSKSSVVSRVSDPYKSTGVEQPGHLKSMVEATQIDSTLVNENSIAIAKEKDHSTIKENNHDSSLKKDPAPKRRNIFINSFALNFSVGPDVSAIGINNVGKLKPVYGAGISYEINKRLTIRSGFYVERKVYDAKMPDYHPPAGFWNYYPYLKYIDADCKVYEVPLIVNYNFGQTPKYQWFGSAGISSFFMKKEEYNYVSKSPSGQTSYNNYTINNKNQHYLSSIRLSVGYERKVKNNISILAEPYLALPLTGVGYGKVKLYSTGILFSLKVKPFAKK